MFSLSVISMIGYGQLVPRTDWGKVITMLYAVVGIPLYILYFMNMGKVLASVFKWFYSRSSICGGGKDRRMEYFDETQEGTNGEQADNGNAIAVPPDDSEDSEIS